MLNSTFRPKIIKTLATAGLFLNCGRGSSKNEPPHRVVNTDTIVLPPSLLCERVTLALFIRLCMYTYLHIYYIALHIVD
jgi:hypothetical protein